MSDCYWNSNTPDTTIYISGKIKFTVGHLALYYLDSLISIEDELSLCSDDPYRNKRRLLFKFSEELSYCMQVAFKTKVEDFYKLPRRGQTLNNPALIVWGIPYKYILACRRHALSKQIYGTYLCHLPGTQCKGGSRSPAFSISRKLPKLSEEQACLYFRSHAT